MGLYRQIILICMSISIHESLVQVWHSVVQFLPDRTKIESNFSEFRTESESFWVYCQLSAQLYCVNYDYHDN